MFGIHIIYCTIVSIFAKPFKTSLQSKYKYICLLNDKFTVYNNNFVITKPLQNAIYSRVIETQT